jgi:hypothetical protein
MKKTVLRFGIYGAITISTLFLLAWYLGKDLDYSSQEVIGYASMIVSLSFVYFGIKHFRDNENNGHVSFSKALIIGSLITLITALAFGILDVIYVKFINPEFMTEYYAASILELQETLPPDEFEIKKAELESQKELFTSAFANFIIMFMTVFVIGFIMSLISSLILQRK